MTTEATIVTTEPAPLAETQPRQEAIPDGAEGTGASEQTAEQKAREASEAGKKLAERREENKRNAFLRIQQRNEQLQDALLEIVKGQRQQPTPQQQAPVDAPPVREQYDSYEAFLLAQNK